VNRRRRRFWVIVAVVAGAALVVFGRPGAGSDEPGREPEQPDRAVDLPAAPSTGPPAPAPAPAPVEPREAHGVVGDEALDPAAVAGARQAAGQFAGIWVGGDSRWYERLAGLSTPALAGSLVDAEPPEPGEVTGDPEVYFDAPQWARIGVPTDRGTVVLDVVVVDGQWLVSAVDWRRP
jgi:hypothetical protein